jgi:sec-independent protein translocase protein TatB
MFDFAWSEILLIGAVALIAIGPKDMPAAIRTVSSMIKKARRMAAEFQTHVDEMVREADLGDVKKAFTDIRNLDIAGALEKHIDPDRSIRSTFADDPFKPTYPAATPIQTEIPAAAISAGGVSTLEEIAVSAPMVSAAIPEPEKPVAPSFIPPGLVPPPAAVAAPAAEAPAFIPPEAVLQRQSKA